MEIKLSLVLEENSLTDFRKVTDEDLKEELTQMLFEVCEDWVIRGNEPDLEFSK